LAAAYFDEDTFFSFYVRYTAMMKE